MMINKNQDQTLNMVELYLSKSVFSHGQLYIALSRAISHQGIKNKNLMYDNYIKNIIYDEILHELPSDIFAAC